MIQCPVCDKETIAPSDAHSFKAVCSNCGSVISFRWNVAIVFAWVITFYLSMQAHAPAWSFTSVLPLTILLICVGQLPILFFVTVMPYIMDKKKIRSIDAISGTQCPVCGKRYKKIRLLKNLFSGNEFACSRCDNTLAVKRSDRGSIFLLLFVIISFLLLTAMLFHAESLPVSSYLFFLSLFGIKFLLPTIFTIRRTDTGKTTLDAKKTFFTDAVVVPKEQAGNTETEKKPAGLVVPTPETYRSIWKKELLSYLTIPVYLLPSIFLEPDKHPAIGFLITILIFISFVMFFHNFLIKKGQSKQRERRGQLFPLKSSKSCIIFSFHIDRLQNSGMMCFGSH